LEKQEGESGEQRPRRETCLRRGLRQSRMERLDVFQVTLLLLIHGPYQSYQDADALIAGDVPLARRALRKLLDGPITFAVTREGYVLKGRTALGALPPTGYIQMVPRKGLEPPQCCHR
jgi:hypothetical protein